MANWNNYYLIRIEFLGFRYHGWQNQNGLKTIQSMVDKTLLYILKEDKFKTMGCGRTDAKVSANDFAFELFINNEIKLTEFIQEFNDNLPSDIRAISIIEVNESFNIIQSSKIKEYHYHFSSGDKSHPFNAPFITYFGKDLDIELMTKAAKLFEGEHNFKRYASKPKPSTNFVRTIEHASISLNNNLHANFTPDKIYVFKVRSKGFLRYQVRLMMGALVNVGRGEWSIDNIENSMINFNEQQIKNIAPSSGLCLYKTIFD